MVDFPKVRILGVEIHKVITEDVVSIVQTWLEHRDKPRVICTPNADLLMKARRDESFRHVLNNADLSIPDGMAVVYASRILGQPLSETVSGRLIALDICELASRRGWSVYFLGGRVGAASSAANQLQQKHPQLKVAGSYCPRFGFVLGDDEDTRAVDYVRNARPDILFVALGAPKQEKWITAHKDDLRVPLSIGIGYAFDVLGGLIMEPPHWMTDIGLEWLYRLSREPRRLWRRYLLEGALFVMLVLKARLTQPK